ncbi:MAG TPA: sulfatase-like hydrolase/transferase [Solirubrobacterales bacterium]|nr:sulfatase-like hydrolase/transferase [Solirubrobacterales bacterium]
MPKRPSILLGGGHLAALWALAVVQPLLSLLGSNPEFFVARENSAAEIIGFALLFTLLPPLAATAVEAILNPISRGARWALHLFLIGLLFGTLILQFLKQVADGPATPMIVLAIAAGALLAWAYGYRRFLRSLADILIPAPAVILVVFLFFSESAQLTTSADDVDAYEGTIKNPAPVVMLVFDEFPVGSLMTPEGEINRLRFPAFAGLADTADWFRNATTRAAFTTIAVPSLMTGLAPDADSLPTADDHPQSIFTFLGGEYRVNAVEPITQVCPESICPANADEDGGFLDAMSAFTDDLQVVSAHLLLPESLGDSLPDISQTFEGFGGDDTVSAERAQAEQWVDNRHENVDRAFDGNSTIEELLAGLGSRGETSLDFAHASDPHYPWTHYPSGTSYATSTEDFRQFDVDEIWSGDRYVTDRATQAHLLDVGYVDRLVGRVIGELKRRGRWDESMFIVTADHGGALLPGLSRREAGPDNMGEVATVPLFVKKPGQTRGRVVNRHTCSTEIPSMIAKAVETELPWKPAECDRDRAIVDNGSGPPVTAPMGRVLTQRRAYVDRIAATFGADTGWRRVLELGPNRDLIGRRIDPSWLAGSGESAAIDPDRSGAALDLYRPGAVSNKLLRQRGTISGLEETRPLAVAVNGRVAAVGESFAEGDLTRYTILLPEWALRPGRNRIELFAVSRPGGTVALTRLGTPSDQ